MTVNLLEESGLKPALVYPHVYAAPSLASASLGILCVLSAQVLMLCVTGSFDALAVVLSSATAAILCDVIECLYRKSRISVTYATLIQGVTAGLFLPQSYPPVAVFLMVLILFLAVRYVAGGSAVAWVNPVAVVVVAAFFTGARFFPAQGLSAEQLRVPNAALSLIANGSVPAARFDARITEFLNGSVFSAFGVSVPQGYVSLFWDTGAAIPAFRFNFITLVSSVVLISLDFIKPLIPALFLAVYFLLVRYAGPFFWGGTAGQGDGICAMLTGGTLFCALYAVQWYGTVPSSLRGKCLYASFAGLAAFCVSGCGTSPAGAALTVMMANIAAAVIYAKETSDIEKALRRLVLRQDGADKKEGHHG